MNSVKPGRQVTNLSTHLHISTEQLLLCPPPLHRVSSSILDSGFQDSPVLTATSSHVQHLRHHHEVSSFLPSMTQNNRSRVMECV
jgi:hypothetical protein